MSGEPGVSQHTMDLHTVLPFLEAYGYWIAFAVGFVEFAGLPMASSAVLVSAGALAAEGGMRVPFLTLSAAAGALLADGGWFLLARWKGALVVDAACGLSSNPKACVSNVQRELEVMGHPFIFVAKFVPGTANLLAPAAGLARLEPAGFLPRLALALVAWAGAYVGLGWIFSGQVTAVLTFLLSYGRWALGLAAILLVGAAIWRGVKIHMHRRAHGAMPSRSG